MSSPVAERQERSAAWSRLHGGVDPDGSVWVRGWLRLVHRLAGPLARRGVHPDAVTAVTVVVAAAVPVLAALGSAWPLVALLLVVVAGVLDGVDGAVAVQQGTASVWGQVWDQLADRCSDVLTLGALWALGAPAALVVAVVVTTLLHEGLRSSARAAGMTGPGAITVWERPSRIVVVAVACAAVGGQWCVRHGGLGAWLGLDDGWLGTATAGVGLALAVVGLAQLLASVRRELVDRNPLP